MIDEQSVAADAWTIAKQVLLDTLGATLSDASDVLASLTDADLLASMTIRGYTTTGPEAVYHVVDHFGMHYGQILYITKQPQGADLGFYRELDDTGRGSENRGYHSVATATCVFDSLPCGIHHQRGRQGDIYGLNSFESSSAPRGRRTI